MAGGAHWLLKSTHTCLPIWKPGCTKHFICLLSLPPPCPHNADIGVTTYHVVYLCRGWGGWTAETLNVQFISNWLYRLPNILGVNYVKYIPCAPDERTTHRHFLACGQRETLLAQTHTPSVEPEVLRDMPSLPQSKQRKKNENGVLRRTCPFLSWVWTSD